MRARLRAMEEEAKKLQEAQVCRSPAVIESAAAV
jgi:hypothetical protein